MQPLLRTPATAYRQVDLDARIEASRPADLTRICLEEAVAALGHALILLERAPATPPVVPLTRAHGIAVYLARAVAPDNPMRAALVQFYGGLAQTLGDNIATPRADRIASVRGDFQDVLTALS